VNICMLKYLLLMCIYSICVSGISNTPIPILVVDITSAKVSICKALLRQNSKLCSSKLKIPHMVVVVVVLF